MPLCVGVAFRRVSRAYWFDPGNLLDLQVGDRVVIEAASGYEVADVSFPPQLISEADIDPPLKPVLRKATVEDLQTEQQNIEKAKQAFALCRERAKKHDVPIKVAHAEYNLEGTQATILFTAESRVDFRELAKDLGRTLRCRVMLYQIGSRDHAKIVGGIGPCGLTTCCSTFLKDFAAVTMKMAKDQSLFLNPVKFSGMCGKLMCCLKYEYDTYVDMRVALPKIGMMVRTPQGVGRVMDLAVLKSFIHVELEPSRETATFHASEVHWDEKPTGGCGSCSRRHEYRSSADSPVGDYGLGDGSGCRTRFSPIEPDDESLTDG